MGSAQVRRSSPSEPSLDAFEVMRDVPEALRSKWQIRHYGPDDLILAAGDEADRLILLARGHVEVRTDATLITPRAPGRLIGELAFIDGQPRSASVFARDPVVTFELDAADVPELMADPAFCRNLARELTWKLREATSERAWRYREQELLFGAMRSFASRELVDDLLARGDMGEPRQAETVTLFADLENFTGKSRTMTPEELNRDLSAFLDLAVEVVLSHGGLVDKFIGDEVMAVWGYAPDPEGPERAFAAAEELVRRAAGLTLDGAPLRLGVGLESGLVTLGVFGNDDKKQFTAIGLAVNIAARLQAETRRLGAPIALGPDLVARLPQALRDRLAGPVSCEMRHLPALDVYTFDPHKE